MMVRLFADLTFWLAGLLGDLKTPQHVRVAQALIQVIRMTFSFALAIV
jgi:hypothetical protein